MSDLNKLFEDPSAKVGHLESTYAMLKSSPDVEPPRRIMFEFEKPRPAAWIWRWLAPMAASAAVAFAVVSLTPRPQAPPQIVETRVVQQQSPSPAPQPVDYQQQINELRAALKARDTVEVNEFKRVRGEMDQMAMDQRLMRRETAVNESDVQRLAALVRN
jgi:hypothetical protein